MCIVNVLFFQVLKIVWSPIWDWLHFNGLLIIHILVCVQLARQTTCIKIGWKIRKFKLWNSCFVPFYVKNGISNITTLGIFLKRNYPNEFIEQKTHQEQCTLHVQKNRKQPFCTLGSLVWKSAGLQSPKSIPTFTQCQW